MSHSVVSEAALTAALLVVSTALVVRLVQRSRRPWLAWTRHKFARRILGITVAVCIALAEFWLSGGEFRPYLLGVTIVAGFYSAGEAKLIAWVIRNFVAPSRRP